MSDLAHTTSPASAPATETATPAVASERKVLTLQAALVFELISNCLSRGNNDRAQEMLPLAQSLLAQASALPADEVVEEGPPQIDGSPANTENESAPIAVAAFWSLNAATLSESGHPAATQLGDRALALLNEHGASALMTMSILVNVSVTTRHAGRHEEALALLNRGIDLGNAQEDLAKVFQPLVYLLVNRYHAARFLKLEEVERESLDQLYRVAAHEASRNMHGASLRMMIGQTLLMAKRRQEGVTSFEVALSILDAYLPQPATQQAAAELMPGVLVTLAQHYHAMGRAKESQVMVDRLFTQFGAVIAGMPRPSMMGGVESEPAHGGSGGTRDAELAAVPPVVGPDFRLEDFVPVGKKN